MRIVALPDNYSLRGCLSHPPVTSRIQVLVVQRASQRRVVISPLPTRSENKSRDGKRAYLHPG